MPAPPSLEFRRIQTGLFLDLERISRQVDRIMKDLFAREGLEEVTPAQANALIILFEHGQGITARQLAEMMSLSEVTVGRFVRALAAGGWLERLPHPTDSRARLLRPTPKAFEALPRFITVANEMLDQGFAGFSEAAVLRLARDVTTVRESLESVPG